MQREVPVWVAVVVIVVVIVLVGAVYWLRSRTGGGPVESRGQIPQPGQIKEGGPYGKQVPPGAPPFMKQQPGGGQ